MKVYIHRRMRELLEEEEECLFTFIDETWCYPGMRHAHAWVNTLAEKNPHEFIRMGIVVSNLSTSHTLSPPLSVSHTLSPPLSVSHSLSLSLSALIS